MTRAELLGFIAGHKWAVQASVAANGAPQAAVIGFAVTDELELVFDTFETSRKAPNLRRDGRIALVIGWDEAQTVQCEGIADEPTGAELEPYRRRYMDRFPDSLARQGQPGLLFFRVRLTWARYSDFRTDDWKIVEFGPAELVGSLITQAEAVSVERIVLRVTVVDRDLRQLARPAVREFSGRLPLAEQDVGDAAAFRARAARPPARRRRCRTRR